MNIGLTIAHHIVSEFSILFNENFKQKDLLIEDSDGIINIPIFAGEFRHGENKLLLYIFSIPQQPEEENISYDYNDVFFFFKEKEWVVIKISLKEKNLCSEKYLFSSVAENIISLSLKEKSKILYIFETIISAGLVVQKTNEEIPKNIIEKVFNYEL